MKTTLNAETLHAYVGEKGLIKALSSEFGSSVKIKIFFPENVCQLPIEELNLSNRGYNSLKRCSIDYIEDLICKIENGDLYSIRNLGKKSVVEIKTKLLEFVYNSLSKERQLEFLSAIIEDNAN